MQSIEFWIRLWFLCLTFPLKIISSSYEKFVSDTERWKHHWSTWWSRKIEIWPDLVWQRPQPQLNRRKWTSPATPSRTTRPSTRWQRCRNIKGNFSTSKWVKNKKNSLHADIISMILALDAELKDRQLWLTIHLPLGPIKELKNSLCNCLVSLSFWNWTWKKHI